MPRPISKAESDLCVDALAEVDAMGVVLGAGQDELAVIQVSGVQIDRSCRAFPALLGEPGFYIVRPELELRQLSRVDRRRESVKSKENVSLSASGGPQRLATSANDLSRSSVRCASAPRMGLAGGGGVGWPKVGPPRSCCRGMPL